MCPFLQVLFKHLQEQLIITEVSLNKLKQICIYFSHKERSDLFSEPLGAGSASVPNSVPLVHANLLPKIFWMNFEVSFCANLNGAGEIKGVTLSDYSMANWIGEWYHSFCTLTYRSSWKSIGDFSMALYSLSSCHNYCRNALTYLLFQNKSNLDIVTQTPYPHIQSPMSSPVQVRGDWGVAGNKNHQVIPTDVPPRNVDHGDMGRNSLSSR